MNIFWFQNDVKDFDFWSYRSGVIKLQSLCQIWSASCFHTACKLRIVFTFLNGWKNQKMNTFPDMWELRMSIKFYWNTDTPICLSIVCACFCMSVVEWRCDRNHMAHKPYVALYRKHLLTSILDHLCINSICFSIFDENAQKILVYNSPFILK